MNCQQPLQESLHSAFKLGAIEIKDVERVAVDTTVQPKATTHPTDAKLYHKAIQALGQLAKKIMSFYDKVI